MRYYSVQDDWLTHLAGEGRAEMIRILRELSLERLQKYPPPKLEGLPIGAESSIFTQYLRGKSLQLEPSYFSAAYRRNAQPRELLLYRALRANEPCSREEWVEIIGEENLEPWIGHGFLVADAKENLICQFSVIAIDGLVFVVDPVNDHGNHVWPIFLAEQEEMGSNGRKILPFHHTYVGLDSIRMIQEIEKRVIPVNGRYLDCGPGSGSIFIYFARRFGEAVAVDINERAAKLTEFNAELNMLDNFRVYADDALSLSGKYGRFDFITWNLPFIFMPEEQKDDYIDGYGGELGIGLCLDFIATLPALLTESGFACVAAVSPIMKDGRFVLEDRLRKVINDLSLDCHLRVAQTTFSHSRDQWHFHRTAGIEKFESVYLYVTKGIGKFKKTSMSSRRKLIDKLRQKYYERAYR